MSMATCIACCRYVDTDDDPDCYYDIECGLEEWDGCLCEVCRSEQPEAIGELARESRV